MQNSDESRGKWLAFVVCVAVAIATILDLVKVNVTIAPIEHTLGATSSEAQLIIAGYILAFGILLVPSGRLGDIWDRKAMFIIGLLVYVVASLSCALAVDSTMLVLSRLLQGIASGILMPQVIGLIQNLFTGEARGTAFGIFGASIGVGTAFGPTVGGLFIGALGEELGWRWTFGMNVPLGLLILPFAIWLLPSQQKHKRGNQELDLVGTLLLAITVLLVMIPLVLTSGTSADNPTRWWLLAGAALAAVGFWCWERRYVAAGKSPVIDFELFRHASYRYGVLITTLYFGVMPSMFFVMTLFNQEGIGHAPVVVGLITIPFAFVSAIASFVSGRWTHRYAAPMVAIGLGLFTLSMIGMLLAGLFAPPESMPLLMAIVLGIGGIGPGMLMSANQMRTLSEVPMVSAGVAGSFMQVGQRLGNAIGIAVASSIFFALSLPKTGEAYRDAYSVAMGFLLVLTVFALLISLIDLRAFYRGKRATASA